MTYPPNEPDLSAVCPYLGLGDDADSHATYATEAHRCYRMPNPTRIAAGHQETYCLGANHVTCPVYTGEGISKVAAPAAAAAAARPASAPPEVAAPVATAPTRPQQPRTQPPSGPRPRRPGGGDGQLRARPRPGGISMPAATIGLFALAIVLIAIAFLISQAVDGNGSNQTTEADAFATQNALKTAQAGNQTPQTTQTAQGNQTPAGAQTQTTQTPGATRTTTAVAGGGTYTVKSGDTCSAIAAANNTTVEKLMQANNITDPSCPLSVGDTLKLP